MKPSPGPPPGPPDGPVGLVTFDPRQLIDCTLPFSATTPRYPGDPAPVITSVDDLDHNMRFTTVTTLLHVGTHVDAPSHFRPGGKTLDDVGPFVGYGVVVDCGAEAVVAGGVDVARVAGLHLLLKAKPDAVVDVDFAAALGAAGVGSVSVVGYSVGDAAHRVFADAGVAVFVAVDLARVPPGPCLFIGAPWRVEGAEGAPARVFVAPIGQRP